MKTNPLWHPALLALTVLALGGAPALAQPKKTYPPMGTIERLDPRLDKLIPKDAVIEKLTDGFDWAEGPVWVPAGGYLLFSDIPKNLVWKWKEGEGKSVYMTPAGYTGTRRRVGEPGSNGLILDPEGRLVLCEHGDRRVTRLEKNDTKTMLVDRYEGKRLNSPNNAVYKSNGDLYFTDPPYGLEKNWDDPARELDFCGVYRLSKDGKLTLLYKDLSRPNGIAFSPDEKTLYVANSDPARPIWMAFDVQADGTLGKGRTFFDATALMKDKTKKGLPDGMKVDQAGNLFATGPGGVLIFAPDGKHLGTLATGVATANCGWGGDGSVLYITADKSLCRIKTGTKGKGFEKRCSASGPTVATSGTLVATGTPTAQQGVMDVRDIDHVSLVTLAAEELEDGLQVQQTRERLYRLIYAGRRHLIVDLRHVEYLGSSAALSLFIMVQKKLLTGGGVLGLRNLNRAVQQLFELTRLTDLFDIRTDPDFQA